MTFRKAIKRLNISIKTEKPRSFRSSWILKYCPDVYRYITKYVRTEVGDINWDKVISSLNKRHQKLWVPPRYKPQKVRAYRSKKEVDLVLKDHKDKLYIFVTALDDKDRMLRDAIAIPLVRIAQKGNLRAQEKLLFLLKQLAQQWIEYCPTFYRWRGHTDEVDFVILRCVRCYRFTGTFIGYLFKSIEYSGLGFRSFQAYSLDNYLTGTTFSMADTLTKDPQTGRVVRVADVGSYFFH